MLYHLKHETFAQKAALCKIHSSQNFRKYVSIKVNLLKKSICFEPYVLRFSANTIEVLSLMHDIAA